MQRCDILEVSRRGFLKAGGLAGVGLAFTTPIIETISSTSAYAIGYGPATPEPPLGPCTVTLTPGDSIQEAVNNAAFGDVICLDGTFPTVAVRLVLLKKIVKGSVFVT